MKTVTSGWVNVFDDVSAEADGQVMWRDKSVADSSAENYERNTGNKRLDCVYVAESEPDSDIS